MKKKENYFCTSHDESDIETDTVDTLRTRALKITFQFLEFEDPFCGVCII